MKTLTLSALVLLIAIVTSAVIVSNRAVEKAGVKTGKPAATLSAGAAVAFQTH